MCPPEISSIRLMSDSMMIPWWISRVFNCMCVCLLLDQGSSSLGPSVKLGSCLSMDGRRHENGQSWHDGCRECYCHDGREMCALISCPVPNCDNPSIRASQCCPSCPGLNTHLLSVNICIIEFV